MAESRIKIFVACHKLAFIPANPILEAIQVGAENAQIRIKDMLHDDTGDNISVKNASYCELTAQYWVWKNVEADYYGFFHYRRYLTFDTIYPVDQAGKVHMGRKSRLYLELDDIKADLSVFGLDARHMEQVISKYDLLTVLREKINTTVYRQYCQYHPQEALDKILDIMKQKYPQYADASDEYMNSREVYYLNMFIMKRELFDEYASWLFDILALFERTNEYIVHGKEHSRLIGFLAERLFGIFYIYHRAQGVKCAELRYLKFYNTEINVEGGEAPGKDIRSFRLKPTKIELKIDMRKLNKMFPAGTYRRILLRNLFLR